MACSTRVPSSTVGGRLRGDDLETGACGNRTGQLKASPARTGSAADMVERAAPDTVRHHERTTPAPHSREVQPVGRHQERSLDHRTGSSRSGGLDGPTRRVRSTPAPTNLSARPRLFPQLDSLIKIGRTRISTTSPLSENADVPRSSASARLDPIR